MSIQDKFNLTGKVALITGASKGIGKAIAIALGEAGAKIVISSRKQDRLNDVAKELGEEGIDVYPIAGQVGDSLSMKNLVEESIEKYGQIDILVNNAATNPVFGPLLETDETAFDKIIQVNLKGVFELAKMVYPNMAARGGGSIINISSIGGLSPEAMLGIYSVLIKTKFSEALWSNEKILNGVMRHQPLEMLAEPEDIAGLALLLASEAGAFCTGAVYTADGGYTI